MSSRIVGNNRFLFSIDGPFDPPHCLTSHTQAFRSSCPVQSVGGNRTGDIKKYPMPFHLGWNSFWEQTYSKLKTKRSLSRQASYVAVFCAIVSRPVDDDAPAAMRR